MREMTLFQQRGKPLKAPLLLDRPIDAYGNILLCFL